LVEMVQTLRL